ncbi:MAG TPA: ATP-binding protein [Polyangiaceae bacterium]|nr:ATP-binding protein [Polyangiaceae bacterium]
MSAALARLRAFLGRIRIRLLLVNVVVVLIPAAGLEFARIYERQLLDGLERDMTNQAVLLRTLFESALQREQPLLAADWEPVLRRAAQQTRTRIRVVTPQDGVTIDSHKNGPPEGPEPRPPLFGRGTLSSGAGRLRAQMREEEPKETAIAARAEVLTAFKGSRATYTRVAARPPAVFLFLAEPIRRAGAVYGAVYVTRSTTPVLIELHRIRRGLIVVLALALAVSALLTLALAWTISRPLERLSSAARRIAQGDRQVEVPAGGGGEISELAEAFAEMTRKLEARQAYISDFAADVAHEFKSPLTSIRGAAELLAEGAADDREARARFLANIALDARRLDRLVSRLLELSRIDAAVAAPTLVPVEPLVRRVIARAEGVDSKLVLRYQSSIPVVRGREADLETALLNLLDNALRYSPPEKPVEVQVAGRAGDTELILSVTDFGPGIAPEHLPRIFDRFFTTDADGEGTGLGLAIVKSVVESHGGTVQVEAVEPTGTRVLIRLPANVRDGASSGSRPRPSRFYRSRRGQPRE